MNRELITTRCKTLCAQMLGIDEDQCTDDASLVEDLGADSLDTVEITMEVEEIFHIELDETVSENVTTFGELVTLVEQTINR